MSSLLKNIGVLTVLISSGCVKTYHKQIVDWSIHSDKKNPDWINDPQFQNSQKNLAYSNETLTLSPQQFKSAEVEGAYLQKIYDENGELVYLTGVRVDEAPLAPLEEQIEHLHKNKFQLLHQLKNKNLNLRRAQKILDPQVVVVLENWGPRALLKIPYFLDDQAFELYVNDRLTTEKQRSVGSHFQGEGNVFPQGPKLSELQNVVLNKLVGDGTLTSPQYEVKSALGQDAFSSEQIFNYSPEDQRFDQVQVYHFMDKAFDWFEQNLSLKLPFLISVELQTGEAERKTNTAFYYHGNVRLGSGDGVNYQNIPRDPSIVIHETSHAFVDTLSGLPFEGQGGSLNEGFADFFTSLITRRPYLAEVAYLKAPYKRTLINEKTVAEQTGSLYGDSLILSGTLWDIKESIGDGRAALLAVKTLSRLGSKAEFSHFRKAVEDSLQTQFTEVEKEQVLATLDKRGW